MDAQFRCGAVRGEGMMNAKGHFEKGVWVVGISKDLIGKKIVRTCPCKCRYGLDYSNSINGLYGPMTPEHEYVILHGINEDKSIVIEWEPRLFPGEMTTREEEWNDENWIEVPQ
jgi:hypothetical protein